MDVVSHSLIPWLIESFALTEFLLPHYGNWAEASEILTSVMCSSSEQWSLGGNGVYTWAPPKTCGDLGKSFTFHKHICLFQSGIIYVYLVCVCVISGAVRRQLEDVSSLLLPLCGMNLCYQDLCWRVASTPLICICFSGHNYSSFFIELSIQVSKSQHT